MDFETFAKKNIVEGKADHFRIINGKTFPFKREKLWTNKLPVVRSSGECSRKLLYILYSLESLELATSNANAEKAALKLLLDKTKDQVIEGMKDLLAISQKISLMDIGARSRFRLWLKNVELQVINGCYEEYKDKQNKNAVKKEIKIAPKPAVIPKVNVAEMFALPNQEIIIPTISLEESVWLKVRQLKITSSPESLANDSIIVNINPNDNRARKRSLSNIREFTGDLECNTTSNCNNNGEILPVLHIESSDLPHCEGVDVDLDTIDYGCIQEICPVENHWEANSKLIK
jgi:hypothetical protein